MRFTTRVLVLQIATVVAVVAVCTGVFLVLTIQQLRAESESSALNIARTVAEDPEVRTLVARYSADPGTPDAATLAGGDLQRLATGVTERTDALFVVITDDHGIRLAHPNDDLLGQEVSTPFADVLAGNEVVDWERGTLGESARAKVPVYPPDDTGGAGGTVPIGEVSVGFERASVFDDLPALLVAIGAAALGSIVLAGIATVLMRRRWERLTLGVQPEELVALVQNQAAVLEGVGDGVLAFDTQGIVRVCNAAAERMLGLTAPVGLPRESLGLPPEVAAAVVAGTARDGIVLGDRVLYLDPRPVQREGRALGEVVVVRDRTDLIALTERLETVRAMTGALRVQRHEFANRLHVAAGLLDADRPDDARAFLGEQLARGPVDYPLGGATLVADPFLQSFLGAKALEAAERGVALSIGDDTLLLGAVEAVEDVAAVLGNLLDNAVTAAAGAAFTAAAGAAVTAAAGAAVTAAAGAAVTAGGGPRVVVTLFSDGDTLALTVADSGAGIPDLVDVFTRSGAPTEQTDAVHGHGFGLPLSRELARRRGGDLWVIDRGGHAPDAPDDGTGLSGAVFAARLPGVLIDREAPL